MTLHDGHERRGSWQDQGVAVKEGWTLKLLGDVCVFQRGLTYSKSDEVDISANVVLRATNIDLATNTLALDELKHISDKTFVPDIKKVKNGSLMICMASGSKDHLGKVAYIDRDYDFAFGGFMGLITARENLLPRYLFHLMTSKGYKDFISGLSDGANINNLTFDKLRAFPVPVPPLHEQQRIVDLLDEVFAGLATAKANAERNLQNARALFASHLQSVFGERGADWEECPLERLTDPDSPITYGVVKPGPEGEIRFVRGGDLVDGKVRLTHLRTITRGVSDQYKRTLLRGGELLICLVGQPGQVGVAPAELAGANIARQVGLIRLSKKINAEFVRFFLQSAPGAEALGARESGSVQQVINLAELRQVAIPYPDLLEQVDIVAGLNSVDGETQRLARIYERKLAALEELKKSLLRQAFNGEL
jgi:type I restriction enzyme S subunit